MGISPDKSPLVNLVHRNLPARVLHAGSELRAIDRSRSFPRTLFNDALDFTQGLRGSVVGIVQRGSESSPNWAGIGVSGATYVLPRPQNGIKKGLAFLALSL